MPDRIEVVVDAVPGDTKRFQDALQSAASRATRSRESVSDAAPAGRSTDAYGKAREALSDTGTKLTEKHAYKGAGADATSAVGGPKAAGAPGDTYGKVREALSNMGTKLTEKYAYKGAGADAISAVGGPKAAGALGIAGAVVAAVKAVDAALRKLANIPVKLIVGGFNEVNKALSAMTGELGPIGALLGVVESLGSKIRAVGDKIPILGVGLSAVGGLMEQIVAPVQGILTSALALARTANPAVYDRFAWAVKDSAAVLGRVFIPLVELLTRVVRTMGDFMASVLPSQAEMEAFVAELQPLFDAFRQALTDLAPAIRTVTTYVMHLATGLARLYVKFAEIVQSPAFRMLMMANPAYSAGSLIGRALGVGSGGPLADSTGAAASSARSMGVEEAGLQLQLAALASGGGTIQQQQLSTQQQQLGVLQQIKDTVQKTQQAAEQKLSQLSSGASVGYNIGMLALNALRR